MKKILLVLLCLSLWGCRQVPYVETLRPNEDIGSSVWGKTEATYWESLNQEVGPIGGVTSIDTTRIASWNGYVTASGSSNLRLGWTPQTDPKVKIKRLVFNYAAYNPSQDGPSYIGVDVYLNGELVGSVVLPTGVQPLSEFAPLIYSVGEVSLDLPRQVSSADIATLETELTYGAYKDNLYAIECDIYSTEKEVEKSLLGLLSEEKQIGVSESREKKI